MTMQICDTLVWQGVEHTVLSGGGPLLEAWPEKKRPEFQAMSSACWRGFIADWLVDDKGWLRVTSVRTGSMLRAGEGGRVLLTQGDNEALYDLFPGRDGPVTATWFSGDIETGWGSVRRRRPYDLDYQHYRVFHIEAGCVVGIEERDTSCWEDLDAMGTREAQPIATIHAARMGITLNSGREISLARLEQSLTYGGLLAGIPYRNTNAMTVRRYLDAARRLGPEDSIPCLISPVIVPLAVPPAHAKVLERTGMTADQHAAMRQAMHHERLPGVACIGVFESNALSKPGSDPYSSLTVVWFQENFPLPIDGKVLDQIKCLEWDVLAKDWNW